MPKPEYPYRILFLKEFTKELILQSKSSKPGFQEENLLLLPIPQEQEEKTEMRKEKIINSSRSFFKSELPATRLAIVKTVPVAKTERKQFFIQPSARLSTKPLIKPMTFQKPTPAGYKPSILSEIAPEIQPAPTFPPQNFDLKELNILVKDPRVTLIECPGPNKFILARTEGKTTMTKINLSQENIQEIIEKFSQASKIPVVAGLFKAAVGNLIITAVISELAGSRFIITKITPRFIIEQRNFGY